MHGLGSEREDAVATKSFVGCSQRGEGRANDEIDVGDAVDSFDNILDQNLGVGCGAVHFPITGNEGTPGVYSFRLAHG